MKNIFLYSLFLFIFQFTKAQEKFTVYFESNKFDLNTKENATLNKWISENKNNKIIAIHGFTDEDGTNGFNDTLAQNE